MSEQVPEAPAPAQRPPVISEADATRLKERARAARDHLREARGALARRPAIVIRAQRAPSPTDEDFDRNYAVEKAERSGEEQAAHVFVRRRNALMEIVSEIDDVVEQSESVMSTGHDRREQHMAVQDAVEPAYDEVQSRVRPLRTKLADQSLSADERMRVQAELDAVKAEATSRRGLVDTHGDAARAAKGVSDEARSALRLVSVVRLSAIEELRISLAEKTGDFSEWGLEDDSPEVREELRLTLIGAEDHEFDEMEERIAREEQHEQDAQGHDPATRNAAEDQIEREMTDAPKGPGAAGLAARAGVGAAVGAVGVGLLGGAIGYIAGGFLGSSAIGAGVGAAAGALLGAGLGGLAGLGLGLWERRQARRAAGQGTDAPAGPADVAQAGPEADDVDVAPDGSQVDPIDARLNRRLAYIDQTERSGSGGRVRVMPEPPDRPGEQGMLRPLPSLTDAERGLSYGWANSSAFAQRNVGAQPPWSEHPDNTSVLEPTGAPEPSAEGGLPGEAFGSRKDYERKNRMKIPLRYQRDRQRHRAGESPDPMRLLGQFEDPEEAAALRAATPAEQD